MFAFAFSILLLPPAPIAHSAGVYTFPISGCKVTYAHSHHNYPATDILGKKGCAYVAVTNGVVDEVNRVDRFNWKTNLGADRGGLSISIVGADGVRYYGSHLMSIEKGIAPGVEVVVGQVLGKLAIVATLKVWLHMCTLVFLGRLRRRFGGSVEASSIHGSI